MDSNYTISSKYLNIFNQLLLFQRRYTFSFTVQCLIIKQKKKNVYKTGSIASNLHHHGRTQSTRTSNNYNYYLFNHFLSLNF